VGHHSKSKKRGEEGNKKNGKRKGGKGEKVGRTVEKSNIRGGGGAREKGRGKNQGVEEVKEWGNSRWARKGGG